VVRASLRYRKARLAFSSLAIVLGVAFVAGTLMLGASISRSFYGSFAAGAQNVSAVVAAPKSGNPPGQFGGPTVPAAVAKQVSVIPGVAAADGRLAGPAVLIGPGGKPDGDGFGISVTADPLLRGFTLVSGHVPAAPDQVDVDTATAADEHFRLGQRLRVASHAGVIRTFVLAGTIDVGVNPQFGNASVTAFQTPVAAAMTGASGYGLIVVRAAPGITQTALASRLAAEPGLAGRYQVQTGSKFAAEEADSSAHIAHQLTLGLLIFALVALVVAVIVVYNTFGILIAQRAREMALLRCVGASRRQVFAGLLAESAVIGLAASLAGLAAGTGLTWILEQVLTSGSTPAVLVIPPSAVAISAATGLAISVGACVRPALAATRIAPVAAMTTQASAAALVPGRAGWLRVLVALLAGGGGALLTVTGTQQAGSAGLVLVAAGGCVSFVAVLALGPIVAPPLISLLGRPGRGVTTRLATANARRNPYRVAATMAALTIGVTLMTLFTVVLSSIQVTTDAAIAGRYPFDYSVSAEGQQSVPPRVLRALAGSADLAMVAPYYAARSQVDGTSADVGAYGHNALGTAVRPAMVAGSLASVGTGTAAVDATAHLNLGQVLTVATPDAGPERLRVVAVYDSGKFNSPLPIVMISTADFGRGFRPAGADQVVIDAARGVPPAVSRAAVQSLTASDPLLAVQTQADYKASLNSGIDHILELVGALLGLAVLIALCGICNTLTLSVIERTMESALMRALGLTRGQLRRMLLTEALLMAVLAVALGVALGIGFGAAIMHALSLSAAGIGMLSLPYASIALYAVAGVAAALAAAVMPARRAARTSVVAVMADS
jgi:putative ABC transport system permease protein